MANLDQHRPLAGCKIAVVVEHKFIPEEIACYRNRFAAYGATVDFISRLWYPGYDPSNPEWKSPLFYSDVDPNEHEPWMTPERLKMEDQADISQFDHRKYDAIIMSANYTSIRLLYTVGDVAGNARDFVQSSPTARAFADAMSNTAIVKGALCHGLWILTPFPELLRNRKVTCHTVLAAQVLNCGAEIQFDVKDGKLSKPAAVVTDDDLVTGFSKDQAPEFVDAVANAILVRKRGGEASKIGGDAPHKPPYPPAAKYADPVAQALPTGGAAPPAKSSAADSSEWTPHKSSAPTRRVLVFVSQHGFWAEELLFPLQHLNDAGLNYDFMVNKPGTTPFADAGSLDSEMIDGPLGRKVNTRRIVEIAKKTDWEQLFKGRRVLHEDFTSVRPYLSTPNYLEALERHNDQRRRSWSLIDNYDALLLVGGSGPIVDMVNNSRLHDLIMGFWYAGKPIAAECYAVACLAFAREFHDRRCILRGKHVTGHTLEYDYTAGWQLVANGGPLVYDDPPFPLEHILRDAVGPEGQFHGNVGKPLSVIADFPFITSRSVGESDLCGQVLVRTLTSDLRRFGW